jgi:hypothetical protein
MILSFDVVSLYTMIPIDEAVKVIKNLTYPKTTSLVKICLRSTFFSFQGELYEQTCSVAMGSPLSPIVANLFMENFEQKSLSSAQKQPNWWVRYVDDTNVILEHEEEELMKFVEHLNSQSNHIKFTLELEKDQLLIVSRCHDDKKRGWFYCTWCL